MASYNFITSIKSFITIAGLFAAAILFSACDKTPFQGPKAAPPAMRDVPAVRLNYKYEADTPVPTEETTKPPAEEKQPGIQADFDATRPLEILDRTLTSPDKKRVAVIYHRISDYPSEYRLDMFSADGKLMRKLTTDLMAVHFPETIVWSPDSSSLAFVAMLRVTQLEPTPTPVIGSPPSKSDDANAEEPAATPIPVPTPAAPIGILTFRTEQIYISNAEGTQIKPLTNNESLIYFYYVWSPDSSMIAALAATIREWKYVEEVAKTKSERIVPLGRPRILEKNGRERRLDDNLTAVRPVWSPDSAKVADAFDTQVRIYDAEGTTPTQAAIPLRNQLLISSQAYDRKLQSGNGSPDANAPANTATPAEQPLSTLPDPKELVSFNPVVVLNWTADDLINFETAYVRLMQKETDSVHSFSRWHRITLSSQIAAPVR